MTAPIFGMNLTNPESKHMFRKAPAKVAFFDFDADGGCWGELLFHAEVMEQARRMVDLVYWPLCLDEHIPAAFDIAIVEGVPSPKDRTLLKDIREKAQVLIAIGTCTRIEELVEVDHHVFGCPIRYDDLIATLQRALQGMDKKDRFPVLCASCRLAGNDCLLDSGQACLGLITRDGCNAICVSDGRPCFACRGIAHDANLEGARRVFERYGISLDRFDEMNAVYNAPLDMTTQGEEASR